MAFNRIKILYLIDYFHRTGGTESHLVQLIAGLPADQFQCSVVAFDLGENPLLEGLRSRGVSVVHLPVAREYVPNALVRAWRLSRLIRCNGYDIVQTFHQKADTYGALVPWLSGAGHVISSKRDTGELRKPQRVLLNRCLKRLFDRFIMVADSVRAAVLLKDRLPAGRVTTIYNGVDPARFVVPTRAQRADARQRFGFAMGDFVVGMVSAFRPEKSHDVFFAGVSRAAREILRSEYWWWVRARLLDQFREQLYRRELRDRTYLPETSPMYSHTFGLSTSAALLRAVTRDCLTRSSSKWLWDFR